MNRQIGKRITIFICQSQCQNDYHYTPNIAVAIKHSVHSEACLMVKDVIKNVNYSTIEKMAPD